jgi:transposase
MSLCCYLGRMARKPSPRAVREDAWAWVAPYLLLLTADARQRAPSLREVCTGLRWLVRAGAAWRRLPHDLPPWHTVDHQSPR